jgi:hypothetical protein
METLVATRGHSRFEDIADFAARIDPSQLHTMQLENLIRAGAFDRMEDNRARVVSAGETILRRAQVRVAEKESGQIGLFGAARVFVKPWVPANYLVAFDASSPSKPLVMRAPTDGAGLQVVADLETFPLRAQYMQREFGFGAWNRTNGAVLRFNNASYAAPTLTL